MDIVYDPPAAAPRNNGTNKKGSKKNFTHYVADELKTRSLYRNLGDAVMMYALAIYTLNYQTRPWMCVCITLGYGIMSQSFDRYMRE